MNVRIGAFLGSLVAALAVALVVAGAAAAILVPAQRPVPSQSAYLWMQPGTALVKPAHTQLPAWITASWGERSTQPSSAYIWGQPPARIPTA